MITLTPASHPGGFETVHFIEIETRAPRLSWETLIVYAALAWLFVALMLAY